MPVIDLNCDIGESTSLWSYNIDHDISLLPYLSSINIAAGSHAGDGFTAHQLIARSRPYNIAIGAHPSFPDRENFGRKETHMAEKDLHNLILQQIEFIAETAMSLGIKMRHVKPHGALYNMAAKDPRLALIVCSAIQSFDRELMVYGLSGSEIIKAADKLGMKSCSEVFADRTYQDDGSLTPRSDPKALIHDTALAMEQVLQLVQQGTVTTVHGNIIAIRAETICLHSDGENVLSFAQTIHDTLQTFGVAIFHP
jgi:5-oxoprolinase (ATP-hydrolysing) subunit A